eukprot:4788940-Alexandrium_andersonii.AAC.1
MSASLVGSEMCIRDSMCGLARARPPPPSWLSLSEHCLTRLSKVRSSLTRAAPSPSFRLPRGGCRDR